MKPDNKYRIRTLIVRMFLNFPPSLTSHSVRTARRGSRSAAPDSLPPTNLSSLSSPLIAPPFGHRLPLQNFSPRLFIVPGSEKQLPSDPSDRVRIDMSLLEDRKCNTMTYVNIHVHTMLYICRIYAHYVVHMHIKSPSTS